MILRRNHLPYIHVLFLMTFSFSTSKCQGKATSYCGNIKLQEPFLDGSSTLSSSPLFNHVVLCKSQTLYFRTSIGLFEISSIDYANKVLIVSHSSCSSASHFVSPLRLAAGFPHFPERNSLLLFNCLHKGYSNSTLIRNCTKWHGCEEYAEGSSSCLVIDDIEKMDKDFNPKEFNCTHYNRVYKESSEDENATAYRLGTRISFGIPDHLPNPCDECKRPDGHCGVGLKCFCHLKECKDKVVSGGDNLKPSGNILFSLFLWWTFLKKI